MAVNTNMRVLIVDDFSTMRRIIKNILRQLGFTNIIEADDGSAAWEILNKDQVDFIISDWNMPQMTGIELLRKVRASEEFADLPFLMVTGGSPAGEHHRGRSGQGFQLYRQALHCGNPGPENRQNL